VPPPCRPTPPASVSSSNTEPLSLQHPNAPPPAAVAPAIRSASRYEPLVAFPPHLPPGGGGRGGCARRRPRVGRGVAACRSPFVA
jgi:hypothetical protein